MTTVVLNEQKIRTVTVPIIGSTALICHAWSDKAKKQMLDKQMKKAAKAREAKDPKEEFEACLYQIGRNKYGFPADAFKSAAIRAGKLLGLTMTDLRQMFFVEGDGYANNDPRQMVAIKGKPTMRQDMVRLSGSSSDIRFRAEFIEWSADVKVTINESLVSLEQIFNLFEAAGFSVGVGDWRPERNGTYGRFQVKR